MRAECGLGAAADEAPSDELARLFAMVDLDGSGAISGAEFAELLSAEHDEWLGKVRAQFGAAVARIAPYGWADLFVKVHHDPSFTIGFITEVRY